ncbi:hypothetical protein Ciccas_003282 [Cichlidogyrus casuarinus]|uniref:Uncharacterized protein n=1 Tax=Cichlidogyrus casuarinus TaxID=1844966 RepID=A0ABD2QEZ6_9PLAT
MATAPATPIVDVKRINLSVPELPKSELTTPVLPTSELPTSDQSTPDEIDEFLVVLCSNPKWLEEWRNGNKSKLRVARSIFFMLKDFRIDSILEIPSAIIPETNLENKEFGINGYKQLMEDLLNALLCSEYDIYRKINMISQIINDECRPNTLNPDSDSRDTLLAEAKQFALTKFVSLLNNNTNNEGLVINTAEMKLYKRENKILRKRRPSNVLSTHNVKSLFDAIKDSNSKKNWLESPGAKDFLWRMFSLLNCNEIAAAMEDRKPFCDGNLAKQLVEIRHFIDELTEKESSLIMNEYKNLMDRVLRFLFCCDLSVSDKWSMLKECLKVDTKYADLGRVVPTKYSRNRDANAKTILNKIKSTITENEQQNDPRLAVQQNIAMMDLIVRGIAIWNKDLPKLHDEYLAMQRRMRAIEETRKNYLIEMDDHEFKEPVELTALHLKTS